MHVNTVHTAALVKMTKPAVVHPGKILPGKLLFSLSIVKTFPFLFFEFAVHFCALSCLFLTKGTLHSHNRVTVGNHSDLMKSVQQHLWPSKTS